MRWAMITLALLGLGVASCGDDSSPVSTTTTLTLTVTNQTFNVPAGQWAYYDIDVSSGMQNPHLVGSFTAYGGSGNDIKTLVMNSTDYTNWSNGHPVTPHYSSGQLTTAQFDVNLSAGTYYLVYDNTFSTISSKDVTTRVDLVWEQ